MSETDEETDREDRTGDVEISVECGGEVVHTSTHARPIEQPSENEPVVVSDEFPDERNEIYLTVRSANDTLEKTFETGAFEEYDGYCIDIHVMVWEDRLSASIFDTPYDC